MARSVDFVSIGHQTIDGITLRCVPLADPNAPALYRRRLQAALQSDAEYLCFVDGGADLLLPGFVDAMQALADRDAPLGYAAELVNGAALPLPPYSHRAFMHDHSIIHHGVVCRTRDLRCINWPAGVYSWEVIAYGLLAQVGHAFDPVPRYDWRPCPGGARLWPSYCHGIVNSKIWLQSEPARLTLKKLREVDPCRR